MAVLRYLHICLLDNLSPFFTPDDYYKIAKKIVQNNKYDQEVIRRRRRLR